MTINVLISDTTYKVIKDCYPNKVATHLTEWLFFVCGAIKANSSSTSAVMRRVPLRREDTKWAVIIFFLTRDTIIVLTWIKNAWFISVRKASSEQWFLFVGYQARWILQPGTQSIVTLL
jgi:predicted protein tyrosine phosphatase